MVGGREQVVGCLLVWGEWEWEGIVCRDSCEGGSDGPAVVDRELFCVWPWEFRVCRAIWPV